MFERLAHAVTLFSVRRPWWVCSLFVCLFTLGLWGAGKLELRLNYMELLPEDAPEVVDLKWVMQKAGTDGYLVIEIGGGTRDERLEIGPKVVSAVEALPEIHYAEFRNEVSFFRKNAGALLPKDDLIRIRDDLDARVKAGIRDSMDLGLDDEPEPKQDDDAEVERMIDDFEKSIPPEILENEERQEIYILAKPALATMNVPAVKQMLRSVDSTTQAVIKSSGKPFRSAYGGPAVFVQAFNDGVQKDLGIISLVALLCASGLLLFATRRPLASLFILLPIAGAISCALGIAAFTIGHLNIISSLLVAILLGLGVEFGIHLVLRTNEASVKRSVEEALLEAVPATMAGAFSGAITNAAAFLVLVFAGFSAYRQFGVIASIGILLSWAFSYTLLPALIVITERALPGWVIRSNQEKEASFLPPRWLLWVGLVVLPLTGAFGIWSLPRVGLERSFTALHGDTAPNAVGLRASEAMGSTLSPAFIWVDSLENARKVDAIFDRLKAQDQNPKGSIIKTTLSLGRMLHDDWTERKPVLDSISKSLRKLPDSVWKKNEARLDEFLEAVSGDALSVETIPEAIRRKFTPRDKEGTFVLYFPSRSVDDAQELDDFVDKLELAVDEAASMGIRARVMSENRIAVHIFRQVFADAPFIAWAATLVALGVLFLLLRNIKETLIVFTPLTFGMAFMIGGMYVLDVKLNFINMCVIPSIFTVAIDNTVHLYHRYKKEGQLAMPRILANTGLAIVMASLVNASGYAPMLLADFYGLKSLGIVASLGMLGMVLSTVVWFPALLVVVPEKWIRKK